MKNLPLALLVLFFIAEGCSHSAQSTAPIKVEMLPGSEKVRVQVRALEILKIAEEKKQPYFQFDWPDRKVRVGHGKWKIKEENPDWNKMYGWGPVVWVTKGKQTRVLDLRKDFPSHYVAHVFQSEESGWIYLFLDYGIEGPKSEYPVWISRDKGETWFAGASLQRPPQGSFPPASLSDFVMNHKGEGTVWFKMPASDLTPAQRGDSPLWADLYFEAHTRNGGGSWEYESEPRFSSVIRQEQERHY